MPKTSTDAKPNETDIVPAASTAESSIVALRMTNDDMEAFREAVAENLGSTMRPWDLPEVKTPGSGGTTWKILTAAGERKVDEFRAIVVAKQDVREYYDTAYDGESKPPTCASPDRVAGFGKPGGLCAQCPLKELGTKPGAKPGEFTGGSACSERIHMLLMTEFSAMPYFYNAPILSVIRGWRPLFNLVTGIPAPYWRVELNMVLACEKNSGGIETSVCRPVVLREPKQFSPEQLANINALHSAFGGVITRRIEVIQADAPAAAEVPEPTPDLGGAPEVVDVPDEEAVE
jgi:hypothetical protein